MKSTGVSGKFQKSKANLEEALAEQRSVLVIKNSDLGNKTVLWSSMGRCVDGLVIVAATGSVFCALDFDKTPGRFAKPLCFIAFLMHAGYLIAWKRCPIMDYKVVQGPSLWSAIRRQHNSCTVLTKRPSSNIKSYFTSVSCIIATVAAFWVDLRSVLFNGILGKVKAETTDAAE